MAPPPLSRMKYFEEIEVGTTIEHEQSRTMYASDVAMMSSLFLHHNPHYLDADRAREAGHPDIVLNPYYLFNLVLGISVRELTENAGPFLGAEKIEFLQEVYPGMSIRARSVVVAKRESNSRPGWGIVTWETVGWSPALVGDVIRYDRSNLVPFSQPEGKVQ